ncbi:CDGSH iron-sulfur domain-containing protein [Streptomyces sp. NBC_01257]|uniref:CDGSH iron-sulfur domain-containing protein n=1 Tax=Streptomyces sp. NBC_01257 TaxID=2903799 RepID=UPI002DDA440E|nr:CDGSH iron-sulfur domain-containing protein [Streptomyces sp. NBC_01257]WRZ68371.1 CDGSH iron-sulfur domain-containing protein [Streptomyces sp. NBC_01257]
MPAGSERPRRITLDRDGPLLVEGPVEVTTADGEVHVSERFVVALCVCRRSGTYPWCDTSHRVREGTPAAAAARRRARTGHETAAPPHRANDDADNSVQDNSAPDNSSPDTAEGEDTPS